MILCYTKTILRKRSVEILEHLADRVAFFFVQKGVIPEEKRDISRYGVELFFSFLIGASVICIAGALAGFFLESLVFLITLALIRSYTGGYHANSFILCNTISILSFLLIMALSLWLKTQPVWVFLLFQGVSMLLIALFAPVENPNKPLSDRQKRCYRVVSIVLTFLLSVGAVVLLGIRSELASVITLTLSLTAVMLVVEIICKGVGKKHEKE